jgi:hypothetical protein
VPVNVPVLLVVSPTVPLGVMNVPGEVSVTVTVHEAAVPTVTDEVQMTDVRVALGLTTMLVVPLLPECAESPP